MKILDLTKIQPVILRYWIQAFMMASAGLLSFIWCMPLYGYLKGLPIMWPTLKHFLVLAKLLYPSALFLGTAMWAIDKWSPPKITGDSTKNQPKKVR